MAWRNKEEDKLERREENARAEKQGAAAGEKEKKTWKEIDAKRDGSSGARRDEPRPAKRETPAYKSYKSKLDKMFDGVVKSKSGAAEVEVVHAQHKGDSKMASASPTGESARVTSNSALDRASALFSAPKQIEDAPLDTALLPKEQLKQAESAADIEAAARACLAEQGLPKDAELLAKVLSLDSEDLLHAALELLLDMSERGRPKNVRLLVERMRVIEPKLTDPETRDVCQGLIARFGA